MSHPREEIVCVIQELEYNDVDTSVFLNSYAHRKDILWMFLNKIQDAMESPYISLDAFNRYNAFIAEVETLLIQK